MGVWYLELDDEITDAVARLRAAGEGPVILVLPPGSRVGTGRINFRLLAREATSRAIELAVVSPDAQIRTLAGTAGIGAYGTVGDAERALGLEVTDDSPPIVPAHPAGADGSPAATTTGYALAPRSATGAAGDGAAPIVATLPADRARIARRGPSGARRAAGWAARGAVVGVLLAALLYIAYQTIPTATVALVPGTTQLPPTTVRIVASPDTEAPDAGAGRIPAEWRQYPLAVTRDFTATGTEDRSVAATGMVRLTNWNTVSQVVVGAGARVSTNNGSIYRTQEQVTLPRWDGSGPKPAAEVAVKAAKRGPAGNTGADTITNIEKGYDRLQVRVTNPQPVSGGTRDILKRVTKDDCEGAVAALRTELGAAFATQLAGAPTPGMTLFPESGALGRIALDTPCDTLVGTTVAADAFSLTASTTATALEVDTTQLEAVAAESFRINADPGMRVDASTIQATMAGDPEVSESAVIFPLGITARVQLTVDPIQIREEIAGKGVDEARSILARYGEAVLQVWPDFIPTVPNDPGRIGLTIS